ncbi:Aste57867_11030 [Aphanomyces stellatus]|uniref:Aste57867_11030 protein n=1 Tax=Aphanomyces stellatus TaxID=120398 RepID=A0A485KRU2_9STRA|nr:hypothetical protein As57867_010988 [Aphanomyces stellatus]VFT87898.1 Aste57867_11030 [Aphanomyces stellatus]
MDGKRLRLDSNEWGLQVSSYARRRRVETKVSLLKNHSVPTGDPDCPPPDVVRAKRTQHDIDLSVSVLTMDEVDDEEMLDAPTPPTQTATVDDMHAPRTGLKLSELSDLSAA